MGGVVGAGLNWMGVRCGGGGVIRLGVMGDDASGRGRNGLLLVFSIADP